MPAPHWVDQAISEEFSWSRVLGSTRGAIKATAPGLLFVIVLVATHDLLPTLTVASAVALIAYVIRFVQHQGIGQILSDLFGVVIDVIFAAATERGENYFAWSITTNVAVALAFALSVLCGKSLVAQFYGPLTSLAEGWQSGPAYTFLRRSCATTTWMWAGIFALRTAVQAPLRLASQVAGPGVSKPALGPPLFAVGAWAIWWKLKVYSSVSSSSGSSETGDATS